LQLRRHREAWTGNSIDLWREQIGLTRREQETVRQALASAGIWEETRIGVPPRRFARIRLDRLLLLLVGNESGCPTRSVLPSSSECGVSRFSFQQEGEIGMQESRIQVSTEPPDQSAQNRHFSFDHTATTVSTEAPVQYQQDRHSSCDTTAIAVSTEAPLQIQQNPTSSFDETLLPDSTKPPLQFQQDPPSPCSFDETAIAVSTEASGQFRQDRHPSFDKSARLRIR
jgi:hypothetical protein